MGRSVIIRNLDMFLRPSREIVRVLRLVFCLVLGSLSVPQALASMPRPIPVAAKKVVMTFAGSARVMVGSDARLLSPGAQIRDQQNRIVLPSHVAGEYKVRALVDNSGQVHRVWILTPEEIAAPDPKK